MKRFCTVAPRAQCRQFFGKGWDNAALDTVYRALLRREDVNGRVAKQFVNFIGPREMEGCRRAHDVAVKNGVPCTLFLPPMIGDPHRLLKSYSLTAYPILDDKGEQLKVECDGIMCEAFADPDDDYSKVAIPMLELTEFLSQQLLETMQWETTPRGAASLLESLYRGAEIPDHVFQTPAVVERIAHNGGEK